MLVTASLLALGLHTQFSDKVEGFACKTIGQNHELYLQHDTFSTTKLSIKQCDTVTVINLDDSLYNLAFGVHDQHIDYPGYNQQILSYNESLKIDALEAGTYTLHDHIRGDNTHVELTIVPAETPAK